MNTKLAQILRIPSLLLAAALQILPIARAALPAAEASANVLAIIFRWTAAAAAALGGVQAVSGASTVITNPLNVNATNGVPFALRLTTGPEQAHYWTATGLPTGLSLVGTSGSSSWQINGTPTVTGTFTVPLTAKDQSTSGSSKSTSSTLTINVLAGAASSPPSITSQPSSQSVNQGQNATFSVTATGSAPLTYQWQFQGGNLSGQTSSTLTLSSVTTNNAGNFDVIVSNSSGSVTSSIVTLTVVVANVGPTITSQPVNQSVNAGQNASFSVSATGTGTLVYQWRYQGANLSGQTGSSLTMTSVTTNNTGNYDVIVSNNYGSVTSSIATLTVNVSAVAPAITAQPAGITITQGQNATFTVGVSGSTPLTYQWRRSSTKLADGGRISGSATSALTITGALTNDSGSYSVVVTNSAGTVTSQLATFTVNPPPPVYAPLVIQIVGSGTVSPNYNQQSLQVGTTYTVTAKPSTNYAFTGWTGGMASSARSLNFIMQSNLVLQANFMATNITFVNGNYNGLLYEPAGIAWLTSGYLTAKTTSKGKFSAKLVIAAKGSSFSGQFNPAGFATNIVKRGVMSTVTVVLVMNPTDPDQMSGTISDGTFTANLQADRAVYNKKLNPAPQAGLYTMTIPGMADPTAGPAGNGYCSIKIDGSGILRMQGALADGERLTQTTTISKFGTWPLFYENYPAQSALLAWITFSNLPSSDLGGTLNWLRGQLPSSSFYPSGFGLQTTAFGSSYTSPAFGHSILNFASGKVVLTGGNLAQSLTNNLSLNILNKITDLSNYKLKLSLSLSSGLFKGSIVNPGTGKPVSFSGVVMQKQSYGCGYFLGTNQIGSAYFGP